MPSAGISDRPTDRRRKYAANSAPVPHLKTRGRAGAPSAPSLKRWAGLLWVAAVRTKRQRLAIAFESGTQ